MLDQRLHGGIIAVEFAQLDREALAQAARADAGRIEFLQHRENRIDVLLRRTQPFGGLPEIRRQIAGVVDQIDQILPDHALRRRCERDGELFGEMAAKGDLGGDEGFQIVVVVVGGAAAPFGIGGRRRVLRGARRSFGGLLGEDVVEAGIQRLFDLGAGAEVAVHPLFLTGLKTVAGGAAGHLGRCSPPDSSPKLPESPEFGEFSPLVARSWAGSPATGDFGPSLARSSSGFRSSSSSTNAERSRFDSCSSLIACMSCGVITSDCDCRNSSLCVSAMRLRTDPLKVGPILAYLSPKPMYTA